MCDIDKDEDKAQENWLIGIVDQSVEIWTQLKFLFLYSAENYRRYF